MTDNTKMREALIKFGDENPSLDLDFRLHTHGKYLTQEKAIVASRAFKAGAAWQAARTVPEVITTAKMYHEVAQRLYALLDDIDTAGDLAKGDDALYRKIVERTQSKKGTFVIYCDGQTVRLVDDAMLSAAQMLRRLVAEIDRNCIVTPNDNDKILVALDRAILDQAIQIAEKESKDEN